MVSCEANRDRGTETDGETIIELVGGEIRGLALSAHATPETIRGWWRGFYRGTTRVSQFARLAADRRLRQRLREARTVPCDECERRPRDICRHRRHDIGGTGRAGRPHPYIPAAIKECEKPLGLDIWASIHRGSMPELQDESIDWDSFYSDYVSAYLERDVRDLISVKDEAKFYSFMVACAARSGQLFNASDIGNAIDADHKTVKAWVSVLQASNIVRLLQPFWPNIGKSLTKTPKLYFMDTGLVCHLTRWTTPEQLRNGAVAGHVFETFIVSEVLKSYMNAGANLRDVWFYRDSKKREIDLVIQEGRVLHPVEIKTAATVKPDAIKNFKCLEGMEGYEVGFGHVICQTPEPYYVTRDVQAVPVWAI